MTAHLDEFRAGVRAWCEEHIPPDWRAAQTGVDDEEFVRFQKWWFAELHAAGYAVPHWPKEWGGGMSVAEQIVSVLRTGRSRCTPARPRVCRDPPCRVHSVGRRNRRAAPPTPPRHPRRRDLGAGLLRTGGGFGPCEPADHGAQGRRRLRRQRPEAVGERRQARRLVPAVGPHRRRSPQAQRYFVLSVGHGQPRRRGAAHPQCDRRLPLLRGVPQRCRDPGHQPRRR